jgi:hypothetical protein
LHAGTLTVPTATEGIAFGPMTVFHFTDDAGTYADIADYTATVHTGDATLDSVNNSGNVTIVASGDGYDVKLSYTYAEEFTGHTFSVSVVDAGGATPISASSNAFNVADQQITLPTLVAANVPTTGNEGVAIAPIADIATFTDPAGAEAVGDYTATINWGDGNTSPGTVVHLTGNNFQVNDTTGHTYTAEGNYPISVTVQHDLLTPLTSTSQTIVVAKYAAIYLGGSDSSVAQHATYTLVLGGITTGSQPSDVVTGYEIQWGDGAIDYYGTMHSPPQLPASPANTMKTHVYDPNGGLPLAEHITVTLANGEGFFFSTWSATVTNLSPSATGGLANSGGSPTQGNPGQVSFIGPTDPSPVDATSLHYAYAAYAPGTYPGDLTTLTSGIGPINATPTLAHAFSGDGTYNGSGTTSINVIVPATTLTTPGTWTIVGRVIDQNGGWNDYSTTIVVQPAVGNLAVTTFTPTANGFDVTFNRGFVQSDVHLYDGQGNNSNSHYQWALSPTAHGDVVVTSPAFVTGSNPSGKINGTIVWDSASNVFHWVATSGAFPAGSYTVNLYSAVSGANKFGWFDTSGNGLSGNLTQETFTVSTTPTVNGQPATGSALQALNSSYAVYSLPSFARGPGQPANVNPDGTAAKYSGMTAIPATGLPVMISNVSNVGTFHFELDYNPSLLTVTGAVFGSAPQLASWGTINVNISTPGVVIIDASDLSPLRNHGLTAPAGSPLTIVEIQATVNDTGAVYDASELLSFNVGNTYLRTDAVTPADISFRAAEAVHKDLFYGDATGDGFVGLGSSGPDAILVNRVSVQLDSGFYAASLTDPVIIGGLSDGVNSFPGGGIARPTVFDASILNNIATANADARMPDAVESLDNYDQPYGQPGGPPWTFAGIDPTVQIGSQSMVVMAGAAVNIPVVITDNPHGMEAASFTIGYDPMVLTISNAGVKLSQDLISQGWSLAEKVDQAAGAIYVNLFGAPLTNGTPELLDLGFQVLSNAPLGTSTLSIAGSIDANLLVMTPVNGSISVVAASNSSLTFAKTSTKITFPSAVNGNMTVVASRASLPAIAKGPAKIAFPAASVDRVLAGPKPLNAFAKVARIDLSAAAESLFFAQANGQKENRAGRANDAALLAMYNQN